jgi:hypothetical protein
VEEVSLFINVESLAASLPVMCIAKEIQFLGCGHKEVTVSRKCDNTARCPGKSLTQDETKLRGTCAQCDPEVRRKVLLRTYWKRREDLVQQWREATDQGDLDKAKAILERMNKDIAEMKTANAEIGLARQSDEVNYPAEVATTFWSAK